MRALSPFLVVLLAAGACKPADTDTDTGVVAPKGPELSWTAPAEVLVEAAPFTVQVLASDEDGVDRVVTYYRTRDTRTWKTAEAMTEAEDGSWTVELPAEEVQAPGLDLYFKGEDDLGVVSYLPEEGAQGPFTVDVRRVGLPLPYEQGFEDVPGDLLREIGWAERSLGFEGYEWDLTTGRAYESGQSIVHRRTIDGITGEIDDWLVSPVLDLTTLPVAQVSWREYGDDTDRADHSLYISTGSPDPSDGDFVLVTALDMPPEDAWGKSQTVDLSAWADQPAVSLAWVYRGVAADLWWVDDISVRALAPDLRADDITWTPDPLSPGDSGTLNVTLGNHTSVAASDVLLDVVATEFLAFGEPVVVGAVAGDATVEVSVPFTVEPGAPENAWVDVTLTASAGEETWISEDRVLIGQPTIARLAYTINPAGETDPEQLVRMYLGVGDPEAPELELPAVSVLHSSGSYEVELDITEHWDVLPPAPGPSRWWVRAENGPTGSVDVFEITYGGVTQTSTDIGPLVGFTRSVFWLPEPPSVSLLSQTTSPSPARPGATVTWTPTFVNRGADTLGRTTVSVATSDPGITLTSAGPFSLGETGLRRNSSASASFAFDVASDRKSSVPVRFVATVTDDFESFEVPIDVGVPWPVLAVTGVTIDDWAEGNDDGLLDVGETANLEVGVTNVGGLSTFGAVSCELSLVGGTATATVDVSSGFLGVVTAGSTDEQDSFQISVSGGSVGDDLQLLLTCSDSTETYVVPFTLNVGERPWINITAIPDATGDNLKSYRFDVKSGRYRSDGTTLELELTSAVDYGGLSGLFIEAWGNSPGGTFTFYNIVANGATGSVRGYRGGFTPLATVSVTEIDSTTLRLSVPLEPLDLSVTSMNLGFGVGFCGGTAQYCDSYPDGWGAPYTGLVTSRWVTLRW